MNKPSDKVTMCVVRSGAAVILLATLILGAKLLEWNYEDTKTLLALFNAYFPEAVALCLFGGVALVFYRASMAQNDFSFVYFFVSKPGVHEDLWKFGYFVLLVTMVWVVFTMVWRDKLTEGILAVILGAFIVKNLADVAGKAFGKSRNEGAPNPTATKPEEEKP